jgi:chorismate mutase/prephenate dehydratase
LVQVASTAAAAREAAADGAGACIGSSLCAELYGLSVLSDAIQDRDENATRFLLIAGEDAPPTGDDKTSLAFVLRDGKGALREALEAFEHAGVNLTRIESRPSRERAWEYVFHADAEGHRLDASLTTALARLEAHGARVTIFGSYPRDRAV